MAWIGRFSSSCFTYLAVLSPSSTPQVPRHKTDAEPLSASKLPDFVCFSSSLLSFSGCKGSGALKAGEQVVEVLGQLNTGFPYPNLPG